MQPICFVTDLSPGQKKRIVANNHPLMVVNVDGEFFVTDDTCTHAQASLTAGCLKGYEIECPRHGARFDIRTGAVKAFPAAIPLKKYPVIIKDNEVLIDAEFQSIAGIQ